jgi:hypothetical protein
MTSRLQDGFHIGDFEVNPQELRVTGQDLSECDDVDQSSDEADH